SSRRSTNLPCAAAACASPCREPSMKWTILMPIFLIPVATCAGPAALAAPTPAEGIASDGTAQIPASAAALGSEQLTVRDLMRLDSERALETARERRARAGSQAPRASMPDARPGGARMGTSSDAPRLVGIYGVGKRLFAEVRAGAQMFLFLRGH